MNRLVNCTKIKSSKSFENKVLKFFPKNTGDIFLDLVGMFRKQAGSYEIKVVFIIDGRWLELTTSTNDSCGWDWYTDVEDYERSYQNWAKSTVLFLLAENKEILTEFFQEELEFNT